MENKENICWRCGNNKRVRNKIYCSKCLYEQKQYEELMRLRDDDYMGELEE